MTSTLLDLSAATIGGDMTGGTGLSGIVDANDSTYGYHTAAQGYFYVLLPSAIKIDKIVLAGNTLGFDASGLGSNITLNVRRKSIAPSSRTDGTQIGTSGSFVDTNSNAPKEIDIGETTAIGDYLLIEVISDYGSAYACLSKLEVWAVDESVAEPTEVTETEVSTVFLRSCNDRVACTRAGNLVSQFSIPFKLNETRKVKIDLKCDFKYLTVSGYNDVIVVSASLQHRTDSTALALQSATWTISQRAAGGGNILNITQHYLPDVVLIDLMELDAGYHEIIVGVSAGTTANSYDNLAEILAEGASTPYVGRNLLRVEVMPEGTVVYDLT